MHDIRLTFENIPFGLSITLIGMLIVFAALTLITLFIGALPRLLELIEPHFPQAAHGHGHATSRPAADELELVAAIGFALHASRREGA